MKILDFDKFGRYRTAYDNVRQAKAATGETKVWRNIFREASMFCAEGDDKRFGHIFTLENDERVVRDDEGHILRLDCIEDNKCKEKLGTQWSVNLSITKGIALTEQGKSVMPNYKKAEKKYDCLKKKIYCYRVQANKKKNANYLIPVCEYESVEEARKATGCKCIYGVLFEEDGSTYDDNGLRYYFTYKDLSKVYSKKRADGYLLGKPFWFCGKKDDFRFMSNKSVEVLNQLFQCQEI